jgi:hypothetical protein
VRGHNRVLARPRRFATQLLRRVVEGVVGFQAEFFDEDVLGGAELGDGGDEGPGVLAEAEAEGEDGRGGL